MTPREYKDTCCGRSDEIFKILKKLRNFYLKTSYIQEDFKKLHSLVLKNKNSARKMEQRLNIYKQAIENLGFKRIGK